MKPNFALDFRNDAITLLHRTARGWQMVGQVRLDTADLTEALSFLRTTALGLSPQGMTTKLVIPNSQVLYTRVQATAQDSTRRRKQVARALEGVTPYPVADLAFDISGSGPEVDVAVIARETLAEAEAFATEHRFNPVSFVAVPDVPGFVTEPWFGPTNCAANHLNDGQRVERDAAPIVILGHDLPVQDAGVTDTPEPDTSVPDLFDTAPDDALLAAEPVAQIAAELALDAAAPDDAPMADGAQLHDGASDVTQPDADADRPDDMALAVAEFAGHDTFASGDQAADHAGAGDAPDQQTDGSGHEADALQPATTDTPLPPELPVSHDSEQGPAADLEPEDILARSLAVEAGLSAQDGPALMPAPVPLPPMTAVPGLDVSQARLVDEAPMALDVVDDLPDDPTIPPPMSAVASVLDPSIPDDIPPPPPASIMVAFGSRRALEASAKEAAAKAGTAKAGASKIGATMSGMAKAPVLGGISASRNGPQAKVTTLPPRPAQASVVRLPPRPGIAAPVVMDVAKEPAKPAPKTSAASKALRGLGALVTSPGIAGAKERRPVVQMVTPPTGPSSAASAAAATLTKAATPANGKKAAKPYSGGLGNRSMERSKPRYLGLILTGILLVFLVLVAAWSTLFLESRNTTTPDPNAVVEAGPPTDDAAVAGAALDPEMLADLQGPAAADAGTVAGAVAPAAPDPAADAVAAAVAEAVADTPVEPAPATALDTEAAEALPLVAAPQDEFLLATMDEPPSMPDALSLPQPVARNDAPPGPAVPPPPFGTVYRFDADGLIVPTPEGILTPEGVLLFAGRPALEPPQRPASLTVTASANAPEPTDSAAVANGTADAALPTATPVFADPALADARPRPRPAGLTPATQNADDDASLAPDASSRFASLRPRAKPAALVQAAAAAAPPANPIADLGAQGASLTAQADAVAASAAAARSTLTLAVSRKPAPRPKDMSRAVEEAVAVASRQPDPTPPVQEPVAKTEPEADDEPDVAKAMPRLPTSTSVAKQATYVNAINLSKVNLIGIYGSSSDRYALIRQPNGRYKKVKVGDSFDGGRVAAITTSEVRYQKSGKMVTLALPKG